MISKEEQAADLDALPMLSQDPDEGCSGLRLLYILRACQNLYSKHDDMSLDVLIDKVDSGVSCSDLRC